MNKPIYLDYNATTPTDPKVFKEMEPYFVENFGNPSSNSHPYGWDAATAVKKGRNQVASVLEADPKQILFTSGATESNNMAIFGVLRQALCRGKNPHIITSNIEHSAVLEVANLLQDMGAEVSFLPVDSYGQVSAQQVEAAIQPNTQIISIMAANNEIGTINPIQQIGAVAKKHKILFHTDAAQGVGKFPMDVNELNIDFLSISGHKIYAPKGVGALYVRDHRSLDRVMGGGQQEWGLRPGTLNVPGIVGLGKACEIAEETMTMDQERIGSLRDKIISEITSKVPEARLNGHPTERLYNNVSISFDGLSADMFALGLSGLAVSSSSACCSGEAKPSHVLKALGLSDDLARATIRIGLGRFTSGDDVNTAISKVLAMIEKNRKISAI